MSTNPELLLRSAFDRFEQTAAHLERRHDDLRARAGRLERQLLDANRRLEAVLDALDSGVAVVSSSGELMRTNRAFDRLCRDDPGGELTRSVAELLRLVDLPANRTARIDDANGSELVATLIPVGDAEDTRVLHLKDVTDIRREEEEGGRRRRLEALGRMAAELAHEVRNPLGSIQLFAQMLYEDLEEGGAARGMTRQILDATARLESTVSNLLSFAAPAGGEWRSVEIASLARDSCALLAPSCGLRGVRLIGPGGEQACEVVADGEGLRQIVLNLLSNALAATEAGGAIRVDVFREGDRGVLLVSDDGRGIAAEDLPRVLDPFFSRTEGGTGLGLSIVHRIVERHGGRLTLDSRLAEGTRVRVELPVDGKR